MIKFSKEKVLLLHQLIVVESGGANEVRDFGLLESALESAYATYDGKDLYPTKQEKAARLGYTLISNHAFVDGNKRIGPPNGYVENRKQKETGSVAEANEKG